MAIARAGEPFLAYFDPEEENYINGCGQILEAGYCITIDYGAPSYELLTPEYGDPLRVFGPGVASGKNAYEPLGGYDLSRSADFTLQDIEGREVGLTTKFFGSQEALQRGIGGLRYLHNAQDELMTARLMRYIKGLKVPGLAEEAKAAISGKDFSQACDILVALANKNDIASWIFMKSGALVSDFESWVRNTVVHNVAKFPINSKSFMLLVQQKDGTDPEYEFPEGEARYLYAQHDPEDILVAAPVLKEQLTRNYGGRNLGFEQNASLAQV